MQTLAPQLAAIFPEVRYTYRSCGRKIAYPDLGKASAAAMRRKTASGLELYYYPCPHAANGHWHLTHIPQTAEQLAAFEAFAAPQQRTIHLELRQLRRTVEGYRRQIAVLKRRLSTVMDAGCGGMPVRDALRRHYQRLRNLVTEEHRLIGDYLVAVYLHDAKVIALGACQEFPGPCSQWRETIEQRLQALVEEVLALAQANDEAHDADLARLAEAEQRDLDGCRAALNAHYRGTC